MHTMYLLFAEDQARVFDERALQANRELLPVSGATGDVLCDTNISLRAVPGRAHSSPDKPLCNSRLQSMSNLTREWKRNLAMILSNRTSNDTDVIRRLGDRLYHYNADGGSGGDDDLYADEDLSDRGLYNDNASDDGNDDGAVGTRAWGQRRLHRVGAAHVCYLVAGIPFQPYTDGQAAAAAATSDGPEGLSASTSSSSSSLSSSSTPTPPRMVLLGADHRRQQRSFINPTSVQMTVLYEFFKQQRDSTFAVPCIAVCRYRFSVALITSRQRRVLLCALKSHASYATTLATLQTNMRTRACSPTWAA
jgi:hypothetical protein